MRSTVVVGTRGSSLALAQTELVLDKLRKAAPDLSFETRAIVTSGDRTSAGEIADGIFVKEIQRSLLNGDIDLAVHSLKDLPTEPPPGLRIGAIPIRDDPRDGLIGEKLGDLAPGAKVGTGSPRRSAQIRKLRPDVEVSAIRGTVPTRISKVRSGELQAVVLAMAGLNRLGVEADQVFEYEEVLPAPGQGALAVEVRDDTTALNEVLSLVEDSPTRAAVIAERGVLRNLGGGCLLPVGAIGRLADGTLSLDAGVVSPDGTNEERVRESGDPRDPEEIAERASAALRARGALDLLT
jgi:hydroxymethylbilane synthase